jgi:hypothetical protein
MSLQSEMMNNEDPKTGDKFHVQVERASTGCDILRTHVRARHFCRGDSLAFRASQTTNFVTL